jgi:hypothetical protein
MGVLHLSDFEAGESEIRGNGGIEAEVVAGCPEAVCGISKSREVLVGVR